MRSSSGTKRRTASSNEDLPAALVRLDQQRQRPIELAGDRRQVAHQRIAALADDPAAAKVSGDPRQQVRAFQQLERRFPLGLTDHDGDRFHFQCSRADACSCSASHCNSTRPRSALIELFLHAQLVGRLRDKATARPRGIQVERVHVHQLALSRPTG